MAGLASSFVLILSVFTLLTLWQPVRPRALASLCFFLGHIIDQVTGKALILVLASAGVLTDVAGDVSDRVMSGTAALAAAGLVAVIRRGIAARRLIDQVMVQDLGVHLAPRCVRRVVRDLVLPWPLRPFVVLRDRNINYGDYGRRNLLDVYHRRTSRGGGLAGPILIHFHGGHFAFGGKSRESRALLFRLAAEGWTCISAAYRVGAPGRFPASLIDAKRVIAWAREHAPDYGADEHTVVVAGSSAGAHLATMAALTPGIEEFQPGFVEADASVAGAVGLYGYYGRRGSSHRDRTSPADWISPEAVPLMIVHGTRDPLIPVGTADEFVARLRQESRRSVVYLRLPHTAHSFDLCFSPRYEAVIDAIRSFGYQLQDHAISPELPGER